MGECGALNEWLAAAPRATPVCGQLGAMINIADFADRPPKGLELSASSATRVGLLHLARPARSGACSL